MKISLKKWKISKKKWKISKKKWKISLKKWKISLKKWKRDEYTTTYHLSIFMYSFMMFIELLLSYCKFLLELDFINLSWTIPSKDWLNFVFLWLIYFTRLFSHEDPAIEFICPSSCGSLKDFIVSYSFVVLELPKLYPWRQSMLWSLL